MPDRVPFRIRPAGHRQRFSTTRDPLLTMMRGLMLAHIETPLFIAIIGQITRMPVTEIASATGFGSHAGFTRTFRAAFGVTPRDVRDRSSAT